MITRSIGGILRGTATPLQLLLACLLGGALGFMPGFAAAPGLIVFLVLCLIVLNANIGLALLVGVVAKVLAWVLVPVSFAVGRALIDGPTQGLFRTMVNAPVLALFGFEHYLTTGGLVVGLVVGGLLGVVVVKIISTYRRRMAAVEENSERYQKWTARKPVKIALWLLAGKGKGKKSYEELLAARGRNPVRLLGVVVAGVVIVALIGVRIFFAGPIVGRYLRSGLEQANGATVDIGKFEIDLGKGTLLVTDLAMADPEALGTDLFRAARLEAQISTADLLRKRVQIDKIVITDASSGLKRATAGKLVAPKPKPAPKPSGKTLEDYLKDAELWRDRLAQAQDWLEKVGGSDKPAQGKPETIKERVDRLIREEGYAKVIASHLLEGFPSFTLKELQINGLNVPAMGDVLTIRAANLSTDPALLTGAPAITITSTKTLNLDLAMAAASKAGGANTVNFAYRNLPADWIGQQLAAAGGGAPVKGGTLDVVSTGTWSPDNVNLPLNVTLNNTNLAIAGAGAQRVSKISLPLGVTGRLDATQIHFDPQALTKALLDAGYTEFANRAQAELEKQLGAKFGNVGGLLTDPAKTLSDPAKLLDPSKGGVNVGNLLGGGDKKEDKKDDKKGTKGAKGTKPPTPNPADILGGVGSATTKPKRATP